MNYQLYNCAYLSMYNAVKRHTSPLRQECWLIAKQKQPANNVLKSRILLSPHFLLCWLIINCRLAHTKDRNLEYNGLSNR